MEVISPTPLFPKFKKKISHKMYSLETIIQKSNYFTFNLKLKITMVLK